MKRESCIYEGTVRHRRFRPLPLGFKNALFMMYLDLDELPDLFRGRWFWSARRFAPAWFRRRDYLGDAGRPLAESVRDCVEESTGRRPEGPIRLLTHLRTFGYVFNPVSLYYCFDRSGERVETIVAEITNTPWKERHRYVLDRSQDRGRGSLRVFRFGKGFHVSPFLDMDFLYHWRFRDPGRRLTVHMENHRDDGKHFDATLVLRRREITTASLARVLVRYPLMTLRVTAAIYFQAFRLWRKRCPFFVHPRKRPAAVEVADESS